MVISASSVPSRNRRDKKVRTHKEGERTKAARKVSASADETLRNIDEVLASIEEEDAD